VEENPEHTRFHLVISNDTRESKNVKYLVKDREGKVLTLGTVSVPALENVRLPLSGQMEKQGILLLSWEVDGVSLKNHYLTGKPPYTLEEVWQWYLDAGYSLPEGFEEKKEQEINK